MARFAPRRDQALATGILGLVAVASLVFTDGPGRVLLGLAAVLLVGVSVADLLWVPRLAVSVHGIVVNAPTARRTLDWAAVEAVRVDERSRMGRLSRTLEIDAGEHLIVLGRHVLGIDPAQARDLIVAFDPR